jgi:hypothetical protein
MMRRFTSIKKGLAAAPADVAAAYHLAKRDVLIGVRSRGASFGLLLMATVAVVIASSVLYLDPAVTPSQMVDRANILFFSFHGVFLVGTALIIPALAGVAVVSERMRDTDTLMRLSLIGPGGVILAKLFAILALYGLITLGMIPIMTIPIFMVGLDTSVMYESYALSFSVAFSCACCGLLASASQRGQLGAILTSFAGMLCLMGLPLFIGAMIIAILDEMFGFYFSSDIFEYFLMDLNLAYYIIATTPWPAFVNMLGAGVPYASTNGAIIYQVLMGVICFRLATRHYSRKPHEIVPPVAKKSARVKGAKRRRFAMPFTRPIPDYLNAITAKELKQVYGYLFTMKRRTKVGFFILFVLGVFLFRFYVSEMRYNPNDISIETVAFWMIVTTMSTILVPLFIATLFPKDYEQQNIDLLRLTLQSPRQVVSGKIMAGCALLMIPMCLVAARASILLAEILLNPIFNDQWYMFVVGATTAFVCVVTAVALSALGAVAARKTPVAIMGAYALLASVFIFLPALISSFEYNLDPYNRTAPGGYIDILKKVLDHGAVISPVWSFGEIDAERPFAWSHWISSIIFFTVVSLGAYLSTLIIYRYRCMRDR